MIFDSPSVSFLKKTFLLAFAVAASVVFCAGELFSAPLLIVTEPTAKAAFKADSGDAEAIALGAADADGILLVPVAPEVAGTLTLTHPDAAEPLTYVFEPGKTPGKLALKLKLKPASLMISALPVDEVEIFVNGEHRGRGVVTLGGIPPREKFTIEARSVRRGIQSRVVSAAPGETLPVKFDLRGNGVVTQSDGQIVLPELPLVLASQPGATLKADGVPVTMSDGVLRGVEPGERVVEIFLPWRGREVCVYRAAMPARSAMLPGADTVAVPNPVPAKTSADESPTPAENAKVGNVLFVIGKNVTVSMGSLLGLKDGESVSVCFGESKEPVSVSVSGVTPDQAILTLPDGVPAPNDGDVCRIVESSAPRS